ncbi:MAG: WD40 repeat domain-containing protein [Myxococcota bacterium]
MTTPCPLAMAPDGDGVACGDGPELLVYRGNGAPTWRALINGVLVGIGFVGDEVLTLDASGRVQWWSRQDGAPLEEVVTRDGARRLAIATDGSAAILTPGGIAVIPAGGQPFWLDHPGASALSFGPDGQSLGVGTDSGEFSAIDLRSGGTWGRSRLSGSIGGVGWSQALGQWVVTAGRSLNLISGDGRALVNQLQVQGLVGRLAVTDDGTVAAVVAGKTVYAFDLTSGQFAGDVTLNRAVHDVKFGQGLWLGIGLDDAEATIIDLMSGQQGRTEPHPSRARTNWNVHNQVDPAVLRGAAAAFQADGEPVAAFTGNEGKSQSGGCRRGCLWVAILTAILAVGCGGLGLGYMGMQMIDPSLMPELPFP